MQEVKLTDRDFREIKDLAHKQYLEKAINYTSPEEFVCRCYVAAFTAFCNGKGYTIIDGKIYVK